jgi:hypothetical protein
LWVGVGCKPLPTPPPTPPFKPPGGFVTSFGEEAACILNAAKGLAMFPQALKEATKTTMGIKLHKVDPHLVTAPKKIYKDLCDCCREKVQGDR